MYAYSEALPAQPRSNITVLKAERKEMERSTGIWRGESDRKPIPGRRASNRKGTALPSGSPRYDISILCSIDIS